MKSTEILIWLLVAPFAAFLVFFTILIIVSGIKWIKEIWND